MEYAEYHGSFADIPLNTIVSAWKEAYGRARVEKWMAAFEQSAGKSIRSFSREDILKDET